MIFFKRNNYTIFQLKWSKIDVNHIEVKIILAATNDKICLVTALHTLFIYN